MALIKFKTDPEAGKNISIDITEGNPPVITATNLSITETQKQLIAIGLQFLHNRIAEINFEGKKLFGK